MKGYYIYKALDINLEVIYVGLTTNVNQRMKQHKMSSEWYDEADYIFIAECDNKTSMLLYEQYYINKYNPKYNKKDKRYDEVKILKVNDLIFYYEYKSNISIINNYYNIDYRISKLTEEVLNEKISVKNDVIVINDKDYLEESYVDKLNTYKFKGFCDIYKIYTSKNIKESHKSFIKNKLNSSYLEHSLRATICDILNIDFSDGYVYYTYYWETHHHKNIFAIDFNPNRTIDMYNIPIKHQIFINESNVLNLSNRLINNLLTN
jgi:predicted GIY-YIG superfamily endonuclease